MGFRTFLHELDQAGRVRIADALPPEADEVAACDALLRARADRCALDLAGAAPPLQLDAARWAAVMLFRACQFLAFREIEAAEVEANLAVPSPLPPDPAVCWSVDLYFRHLPELHALAGGLAPEDALVVGLRRLAVQWPLSSVGMRGVSGSQLESNVGATSGSESVGGVDGSLFIEHAGLRTLYVDRIIEHGDSARLADPRVAAALKAAVGAYPQVAGRALAASLTKTGFGRENPEVSDV